MASTSEQMRRWTGPALFSFGFRPFFFGAAVWAFLAMGLWIMMLSGALALPTEFDPVSWHAHEFLFGYLGAVVAGFMMTAVPNWTGRLPIVGWPLAGLFALWVLGRVAVLVSAGLPVWIVAAADLAFLVALALAMGREIVAGKNWRNLMIVGLLVAFIVSNLLFHIEAARGDYAAQGMGLRLGLATGLMMIGVVGGRIIPSFTRNWLAKRGPGTLPTPPMRRFDKAALVVLLVALLSWVILPEARLTGVALLIAGVLHVGRLARWTGWRTGAEPLVWVLHLGYLFLPLGALVQGTAILWPETILQSGAQHLWMAGAIGMMTLAVMTRATKGHTGGTLTAGAGTTTLYLALLVAVSARVVAGLVPEWATPLHHLAATGWCVSYGGFALLYGGALLRYRTAR